MKVISVNTIPTGPRLTVAGIDFQLPAVADVTLHDPLTVPDYNIEMTVRYGFDGTAPVVIAAGLSQRNDDRGRPVGPEVTTSAIRKLPVPTVAGRIAPLVVQVLEVWKPDESSEPKNTGSEGYGKLRDPTEEERETFAGSFRTLHKVGSEDRHESVAAVYRHALANGRPATKAVAQAFQRPHSTAARWVSAARDAGALGPAPGPGVAGEITEEDDR